MFTITQAQRRNPTLTRLCDTLPTITFDQARESVWQLAGNGAMLNRYIAPLLRDMPTSGREPSIIATFGAPGNGASLHFFFWPAGSATPIHDHSSWGVYQCVDGALLEDRYERLDDGAQPQAAHLKQRWRRAWHRGDGPSTVGAYAAGIHRIANHTRRPSISVHMYGPRVSAIDGRDYDPGCDFVCERIEREEQTGVLFA